jgi:hypothetical protein
MTRNKLVSLGEQMIENLYGEARKPDSGSSDPTELSVIAELANLASPYAVRVAATLRLADLVEAGHMS